MPAPEICRSHLAEMRQLLSVMPSLAYRDVLFDDDFVNRLAALADAATMSPRVECLAPRHCGGNHSWR
jgi:hypothetical protein